jgi:sigma-B regulation protein RsbU (phosphoserine phosphatase)
VIAVENGQAALDELRNDLNVFDLVLLDLYMPILDGFEVLAAMMEDPILKDIPVVVMSANESNEIIANCLGKYFTSD